VTSYDGSTQSIKGESTGEDKPTEKIEQYEIYQEMLKGKAAESFEQEIEQTVGTDMPPAPRARSL
jgi:type I restriction enzyme, R subunit